MNNSALEYLASVMNAVVIYDNEQNPSWFFEIPKCTSKWLDDELPDHVHPAFKVNGKTLDRVLIGRFVGSQLGSKEVAVSIPGARPLADLSHDDLLTYARNFNDNATGKTVADSGLILLLARKMGWKQPRGNTGYGVDVRDGAPYELGKSVKPGNTRVFRGWAYTCQIAHTTNYDTLPDVSPTYWKRGDFVGGACAGEPFNAENSHNGYHTLTGSGPVSWNLPQDATGMSDLTGNVGEQDYGYRVVGGELQIIEDNDAADPNADLSAESGLWKAILPNAEDDSFTLVAPGTPGTLKWNYTSRNGKPQLDTTITARCAEIFPQKFTDLQANEVTVPHVPYILKELGIFPCSGDKETSGAVSYDNREGEFIPRRGGDGGDGINGGLGCINCKGVRSDVSARYGVRTRYTE